MSHQRCLHVFAVLTFGYGFPSLWIWTSYWHINPTLGFFLIELMSQAIGSFKRWKRKILRNYIDWITNRLFERKHTCRLWQRLDVGCVPVPMFCLALSQNKSGINMSGQFHCGTLTRGRKIMFLYQSGTHSSTFFQKLFVIISTNKYDLPLQQVFIDRLNRNWRMKNSR